MRCDLCPKCGATLQPHLPKKGEERTLSSCLKCWATFYIGRGQFYETYESKISCRDMRSYARSSVQPDAQQSDLFE